jgi:hypothetical protein
MVYTVHNVQFVLTLPYVYVVLFKYVQKLLSLFMVLVKNVVASYMTNLTQVMDVNYSDGIELVAVSGQEGVCEEFRQLFVT